MSERFARRFGLIGAAAVALALGAAIPAQASPVASTAQRIGPPALTPALGTPHFRMITKNVEQIRQLVDCPATGTMYAVGTFSQILHAGVTYARNNVFSFSDTKPFALTGWNPGANGPVNSIALSPDCSTAYLGGRFTKVAGAPATDIAAVGTSTPAALLPGFGGKGGPAANGEVETLRLHNGHLIVGGYDTSVDGSPRSDAYLTSLDPATGLDDGFIRLNISGNYRFPGVRPNPTRVYNQALSNPAAPDHGSLDLVMGDFTSVGGVRRQQIFMLNLATTPATVTGWTSPQFDGSKGNLPKGYPYQCAGIESFYIRAAAWSPDDSTVYVGDTGFHPWNVSTHARRSGLCDAAAAFPATRAAVKSRWINYTGCDSLYAAAADDSTAYFAGHERWSQNPRGCNNPGPGAISAPGIEGLSPASGLLTYNPTRARGLGADDLLVTPAGLWVASDNSAGSQMCGKVLGLAGICFLHY